MGSDATTEEIPRDRPTFAASQRARVLELLREVGPVGLSRQALIFEHRYTQCRTRIFTLNKMGYKICSELREGQRFVHYVLESEPDDAKPLPAYKPKTSEDWCEQCATGLPLFDAAVQS